MSAHYNIYDSDVLYVFNQVFPEIECIAARGAFNFLGIARV